MDLERLYRLIGKDALLVYCHARSGARMVYPYLAHRRYLLCGF